MAKGRILTLPRIRGNLINDLNDYIINSSDTSSIYDDEEISMSDICAMYGFPYCKHKKRKSNRLKANKKNKKSPVYSSHKSSRLSKKDKIDNFNSYQDVDIHFYSDINDTSTLMVFNDIFEFDKFLNNDGIKVLDKDIDSLISEDTVYCCVDPRLNKSMDNPTLCVGDTYGELWWSINKI